MILSRPLPNTLRLCVGWLLLAKKAFGFLYGIATFFFVYALLNGIYMFLRNCAFTCWPSTVLVFENGIPLFFLAGDQSCWGGRPVGRACKQ